MRDVKAHCLHPQDHRAWRGGPTGRNFNGMRETLFHLGGRMHHHIQDNRRAAHVRDSMFCNQRKNLCGIDFAQAYMCAAN